MKTNRQVTRVNRPIHAARKYYTRISRWYDGLSASEQPYILKGIELLSVQNGELFLEIGSGTARALMEITATKTHGLTIGLDLSEGMCQVAQEKLSQANRKDSVDLIQGNALQLPFPPKSFDVIFCSFTLEFFDLPDLPRLMNEILRMLVDNGRVGIVSLSKDQPLPVAGKLYEWIHNRFPTWVDCRPIPVRALLQESGFEFLEDQQHRMWGLPVSIVLGRKKSS